MKVTVDHTEDRMSEGLTQLTYGYKAYFNKKKVTNITPKKKKRK